MSYTITQATAPGLIKASVPVSHDSLFLIHSHLQRSLCCINGSW